MKLSKEEKEILDKELAKEYICDLGKLGNNSCTLECKGHIARTIDQIETKNTWCTETFDANMIIYERNL